MCEACGKLNAARECEWCSGCEDCCTCITKEDKDIKRENERQPRPSREDKGIRRKY
jgi:hypothetical protein